MPPSLLLRVLEDVYGRLEKLGIVPVIAGGLAVSYWGHPRSTQDIDLAVVVADEPGFEAKLRYAQLQPTRSGRVVDLGFIKVSQWMVTLEEEFIDCEIDFLISNSSYHRTAIGRAINCEFSGVGRQMRVLSCEDVLIFKAPLGRLIDLADIKVLYSLNQARLDYEYLSMTTAELQLPSQFWTRN